MAKIAPAFLAVELSELHQLEKHLLRIRDEILTAHSQGRLGFKETITEIPPTKGAVGLVKHGFSIQDIPIDIQGKYKSFSQLRTKYLQLRSFIKASGHPLTKEPPLEFAITQTLALGEKRSAKNATRVIINLTETESPQDKQEISSKKRGRPEDKLVEKFREVVLHCQEERIHDLRQVAARLNSNPKLIPYLKKFEVAELYRKSFTKLLESTTGRRLLVRRIKSHWPQFQRKSKDQRPTSVSADA